MSQTILHIIKSQGKYASLFVLAYILMGCGTLMNGVRQPLEVKSEVPVTVILDNGKPQKTPVVFPLLRRNPHVLKLVTENGKDTSTVQVNRKLSKWLWGNAAMFVYGVLALPIEFLTGGGFRLEVDQSQEAILNSGVDLQWYPDPRSYGTWHMSLAYLAGAKHFSRGNIGPDLGWQLVAGATNWPLDLMVEGFFYSAPQEVLDWKTTVLLNAGVRKTFFRKSARRFHPHFGAGLTWLSQSTQKGRGLPFGVWARSGVDVRMNRFFMGPYLGYSKLEMVASSKDNAINTAGLTWGAVFGMMW